MYELNEEVEPQPPASAPPPNLYTPTMDEFNRYLSLGNLIAVCRVLVIGLIYYNQSIFITHVKQKEHYPQPLMEPWNLIIFFLSSSVDVIYMIGYISAKRFLKKQRKIALEQPLNPHFRIGSDKIYRSFYSITLQYKYRYRDMASPFKMGQIMHFFTSLIIFGKIALQKQGELEDKILPQIVLWLFLLSSCIHAFELDIFSIESSGGPYLPVEEFPASKILQVYKKFYTWRKSYQSFLVIGVFNGIVSIVISLSGRPQLSLLLFIKLLCLGSIAFLFYNNQNIMQNAQEKGKEIVKSGLQGSSGNNMKLLHHPNLTLFGILKQTQSKFFIYFPTFNRICMCLLLFGVFREPSADLAGTISNYTYVSFLFFAEYCKLKGGLDPKYSLILSCKFVDLVNLHKQNVPPKQEQPAPRNDDDGKQTQETMNAPSGANKQAAAATTAAAGNITQQAQEGDWMDSCAICIMGYERDEMVSVLHCGHVFHQSCLESWLKQKKQCPLDRTSIQQYIDIS